MKIKATIQNCLASCLVMGSFQCATAYAAPAYQVTDLGTLGGARSLGIAINEHGQVTGVAERADGLYHAFLYSNGVMHDIGTLGGGNSWGSAINDLGQITGTYLVQSLYQGFSYDHGALTQFGISGSGLAINAQGDVAGHAQGPLDPNGYYHYQAALYRNGTYTLLGTIDGLAGSQAYGLNDNGWVVGFSSDEVNPDSVRAFLYHDGAMADINDLVDPTSGWIFNAAYDINNHGQIIGEGLIDGVTHAFLLTPVPEASSASMMLAGLGLLTVTVLRRRKTGSD